MTLCHTGTRDLAAHVRAADIVVAAAGVPGLITADMVKPGAAVLDVGVSRVDGKIAGDVALDVVEVAGTSRPNPGGVGPMTRAMLLQNVVLAAERAAALEALPRLIADDAARRSTSAGPSSPGCSGSCRCWPSSSSVGIGLLVVTFDHWRTRASSSSDWR